MSTGRTYSTTRSSKGIVTEPSLLFLVFAFLLAVIGEGVALSQEEPQYDEISVYIALPYLGVTEIDALIKNNEVYLPVTDLFTFLKIKNTPAEDYSIITGFFIEPSAQYRIERQDNIIVYGDRTWNLEEGDLLRTETNLYLLSDWFGKIFGLDCRFSFRDLTVNIDSRFELPVIKEMKQEEIRANVNRLRGDAPVDTTIGRSYPGFRFGMADWSVYAIEQPGGYSQARMNLTLGSVIAGGEANASLNFYTGDPFSEKQQHYLWRHVNNDRKFMRQIQAGKIATRATASVYDPVVGVQITNTPTTFRRSFGSYTLTDRTEPGWTVELYVNNVLVDYVKADASGFFSFEVPLVYGNTMIKLKFYGPWGEERTSEQSLTIPYNFIPHREFEYTVSAGVVEDSLWSRFSRASFSYGATRFLTVGGGAEYLSSVVSAPLMPFLNASLRLPGNILLSGEYTYGVRARGTLAYRLPSNIQVDLDYIRYDRDQRAITFNYLEERKASVSLPVRIKKMSFYSRLSYYHIVLPAAHSTTTEWLIAGSLRRVSANLTTYGAFNSTGDPGIYSSLALGIRLPFEAVLMPQVQYNYTSKEFMTARLALEKRLFERGYLNMSFERNFRYGLRMGELGLRYDFSFAQAGISARQTNKQATFVQYARGSIINDRPSGWIKADNRNNVGRGGISVVAFLDLNANDQRDPGEPKVPDINVWSNSGKPERCEKDTTIHITGLEPYAKFFLEADESSFENVSWKLGKKSYAVIVDPNMLKMIEIPVYVRGEATGSVILEDQGKQKGQERIMVNIFDKDGTIVGRAMTEQDGYFSYFGLAPGNYYMSIDSAQLKRLNLISEPDSIVFVISANTEGDYVEGLGFTLRKTLPGPEAVSSPDSASVAEAGIRQALAAARDTTGVASPETVRTVKTDTSYLVIHEITRELVTITEDYFAVQFGAFRTKLYAEIMKNKVEAALDKNVELFEEDGFWKVRITGFDDREDLDKYIPVIHAQGITEIWVITNKAVKGEWITLTKEDSLALVRESVTGKPETSAPKGLTIQVGAYGSPGETVSVSDRLLAAGEKLVSVRNEDGQYKVQITGFADTNEVREFLPLLRKRGFDNIIVLHQTEFGLVPLEPAATAVVLPVEEVQAVEPDVIEEPEVILPDQPVIAEEIATPPLPVPRFVLHAGSYYKRAEAERAKLKIERRLKLPVEIVEEWDSYRVMITGFYTREETYPYYPELAGLGFTDIFVYEKPLIDR